MKIEDLDLKKIKLVTDYEEIKKIVKSSFSSTQMIDYFYKNYYFFKIDNNTYWEIQKYSKYSITKTIWYNDEQEAPEKTLGNFMLQQHWDFKNFDKNKKNFYTLIQSYSDNPHLFVLNIFNNNNSYWNMYDNYRIYNKNNVKMFLLNYEWRAEYQLEEKNDINTELIQDIVKVLNFNNEQMLKRIEKYYYRYNKQIAVEGYWANR